jgi:hypothetical protein
MAEILVSNLCDCRPPLLIGGPFSLSPGHHEDAEPSHPTERPLARSAVALSSGVQPDVSTCPDFRLFSIALRIVFSIACHCSCAGGFSQACAKPCIVIGAHFPLQIDCIFPEK